MECLEASEGLFLLVHGCLENKLNIVWNSMSPTVYWVLKFEDGGLYARAILVSK